MLEWHLEDALIIQSDRVQREFLQREKSRQRQRVVHIPGELEVVGTFTKPSTTEITLDS